MAKTIHSLTIDGRKHGRLTARRRRRGWRIRSYVSGEALPGRPTRELVAASLDASPEGAVPAYAEGGTWHYVPPSEVEHYRRHLRVEVVTVYVEAES